MATDLEQLAFDVGDVATSEGPSRRPRGHPDRGSRPVAETQSSDVLSALAHEVHQAATGVDRVRLLLQLETAVDDALAVSIADAYRATNSWRKLGAEIGVPFQTLHRRHAALLGS